MPCRKFCSSPRAATPPSGLATNTSPCHFLSGGTPFRPFETAASTRSRPTATFHAPARASPPASKRSPNSSIPPLKFRARPEQPSCQSPRKRAPPAPPRFSLSPWTFASGHLFQRPVDNSRFIYKTLICKGEPHDRNRNQTRHRGTCGSQRSRTRLSPRLRNGAPHRAANQRRAALHPRRPLPHALPHGTARLDSVPGKPAAAAGGGAVIASRLWERKCYRRSARNGRSFSEHCASSRRCPMPDWEKVVGEQLTGLALDAADEREVHAELAAHLEETYEALLREGMTGSDAIQRALSLAGDWNDLQRKIQSARTRKDTMTNRITQFWLPGFLTFALSMSVLELVQKFFPQPFMLRLDHPPVLLFYVPWLLTLPLAGALGAYLSKSAGASPPMALFSSLFPVLPLAAIFLIAIPVGLVISHMLSHSIVAAAFLTLGIEWVAVPGAVLLAGGFLMRVFFSRRLVSRRIVGG